MACGDPHIVICIGRCFWLDQLACFIIFLHTAFSVDLGDGGSMCGLLKSN